MVTWVVVIDKFDFIFKTRQRKELLVSPALDLRPFLLPLSVVKIHLRMKFIIFFFVEFVVEVVDVGLVSFVGSVERVEGVDVLEQKAGAARK